MKNYLEKTIRMVIMVGLVAFVGCKDDNKDEWAPIDKAELTSGTGKWKLTNLVTLIVQNQHVDSYDTLNVCVKDNISYFNADGTYQNQAGATKCDVNEPDPIQSGTWEINSTHLTITITGDSPETVDIMVLDETTLRTGLYLKIGGLPARLDAYYTKQ